MAAYLDSAGNVNTAVANDVANLIYAQRAASQTGMGAASVAATSAQVVTDAVTGLTTSASN